MHTRPPAKYLLFLSDFNLSWIFWTDFQKKVFNRQILWQSFRSDSNHSVRTHGRTDGQRRRYL